MHGNQSPSHSCSFVFWRVYDHKLFRSFNNLKLNLYHFNTWEELETSRVDWYIRYVKSCIVLLIMWGLKQGVTHTAAFLPTQKHNEIDRATLRPNKETVVDKPFETSPLKCSHAIFCLSSLLLGRRRLEDYRFKANLVSNRLIIPYLLIKKRGFQKQYGPSWRRSSQIKCSSTV